MAEDLDYFRSITLEFRALKDRVQHFIGSKHWQTVGEWKESVLRAVLRRHLPPSIGVGKGFVITEDGPSAQIDVLLYDRTKPILYQEGDLVIITADLCLGIVEVKTRMSRTAVRKALRRLAECRFHVSKRAKCRPGGPFTGLFSFEHERSDHDALLKGLRDAGQGLTRRIVDCVALGETLFARYWEFAPERPNRFAKVFRAYSLAELAPAYFVVNAVEFLCPHSVIGSNELWYPKQAKERFTLGEVGLEGDGAGVGGGTVLQREEV